MRRIAYLANQFPSPVEPYVTDEISELRAHGVDVLATSARHPQRELTRDLQEWSKETLYIARLRLRAIARAFWVCICQRQKLREFFQRIFLHGNESAWQRAKAILHTLLGAYYAVLLDGRGVDHIHVHHGFFSAWIAMVAARLLGITYSVTLHGSDLLLNAAYLDTKMEHCSACFTVSEFNRGYICRRFSSVDRNKIILRRMGVDVPTTVRSSAVPCKQRRFTMLAVGRLHPVKDHAFLLRACAELKQRGTTFQCWIAGDGPEKKRLENSVARLGLATEVKFLGHLSHHELQSLYLTADVVVLTSKSEGIPVTLMEAMAHGKPVLAPRITGIPELVTDGQTGFLYQQGCLGDFIARLSTVHDSLRPLGPMGHSAREWVNLHFNRSTNTLHFVDALLHLGTREARHANPVLQ